jgi:hypothetical protein
MASPVIVMVPKVSPEVKLTVGVPAPIVMLEPPVSVWATLGRLNAKRAHPVNKHLVSFFIESFSL